MNRMALITGASRGIGRGIAETLAGRGWDLVLNYAGNQTAAEASREAALEAASRQGHSIRVKIVQADIGVGGDREHLIKESRHFGERLDLLVNNAGITSIGRADILEAREEDFDRLMAINLKGPYFLTQLAALWMLESLGGKVDERHGPKIVTISSISAFSVSTNRGDYCMGKAALGMMTKLYAARLAEHGILVYEVCPGVIESDMTAPVKEKYDRLFSEGLAPLRRWGQPEDVGEAVAALADGAFPYCTGEQIRVDGGYHIQRL